MIGGYPEIVLAPPAYRRTMLPPGGRRLLRMRRRAEPADRADRPAGVGPDLGPAAAAPARAAKATIVDVGGGPGAYAVPLALAGHASTSSTRCRCTWPRPGRRPTAAETRLASAEVGDARELVPFRTRAPTPCCCSARFTTCWSRPSGSRHWPRPAAVLRPGGVLVAVRDQPVRQPVSRACGRLGLQSTPEIVESGLHTGTHRNPARCRTASPPHTSPAREELAAEVAAAGLRRQPRCSRSRVPATLDRGRRTSWLDDPVRRAWLLRQLDQVETEPVAARAPARTSSPVGRGHELTR